MKDADSISEEIRTCAARPEVDDVPWHRLTAAYGLKDGYPYHALCLEDGTIVTGRDRSLKKQRRLPLLFEIFCKCSAMASWICDKE